MDDIGMSSICNLIPSIVISTRLRNQTDQDSGWHLEFQVVSQIRSGLWLPPSMVLKIFVTQQRRRCDLYACSV